MAAIPRETKVKIERLLKTYQNDPILPLELSKLIPQLRKNDASVKDFVNFYQRDPLLCTYLIDLAWQATSTRENHPTAADHAMSTIGITGARQFLVNIKADEATPISKEVTFLLSSALLAAELAKNLAKEVNKKQNLYWAALAHQFPDIILWHIDHKAMWKIHYRQAQSINRIEKVDQRELGFSRNQWRQQVALTYHMSELNCDTFKKAPPNYARQLVQYSKAGFSAKTPALKSWHKTDSWLILSANWLAKSLTAPWLKNSHQHYYLLAKQAFGLSDKQIKQAIAASLRSTSENLFNSSLLVPSCCFLFLPQPTVYPKWLLQAEVKKAIPKSKETTQAESSTTNKTATPDLKSLLNKLLQTPEKFSNSAELLTESFKAMTLGLGFSRVVFMTVDWNKKLVSSKLSILHPKILATNKIRPDFEFSKPTPLRKFLQGKGFLIFDQQKHQKIWSKMPLAVGQQKIKQFILFSVMPQQKVKAIIYVDGREAIMKNEIKIKQLKILLNAVNRALAGKSATKTA